MIGAGRRWEGQTSLDKLVIINACELFLLEEREREGGGEREEYCNCISFITLTSQLDDA